MSVSFFVSLHRQVGGAFLGFMLCDIRTHLFLCGDQPWRRPVGVFPHDRAHGTVHPIAAHD